PPLSNRRLPSPGARPSFPRCAGQSIPAAQAPIPAVVSLRSRRWPSRRRTTRAPPPSTSRAFHLPMAAFQVSTYGRFWVSTEAGSSAQPTFSRSATQLLYDFVAIDVPSQPHPLALHLF